jgi:hypothetical protein
MKSIYFSNKKSLQIVSPNIRNDIKTQINQMGSFNLNSKYYTFLNKKNVNNLKENKFLVSLSTFGKKFVLYLTRYNQRKYCIFINKKNDTMTITQLKFADELFNGTLFDGELVKNSDEKWIYLINDVAYYKGINIITKSFYERQEIIENIITNEQENNDINETLFISKKWYFEYKNIKDLSERYINQLNFKCSGLFFKNLNNFSDNYLFIFPECRTDSKILNNTNKSDFKKKYNDENEDNLNDINNDNNNNCDDLFSNVEMLDINIENDNEKINEKVNEKNNEKVLHNMYKLDKTTCRFLINPTIMPDIYELYCKNSNNYVEKYSYAGVPDLETSDFLKNIFDSKYNKNEDITSRIQNGRAIYVECNYHKNFKKWVPYKKVDSFDSINIINQIQIILDSL